MMDVRVRNREKTKPVRMCRKFFIFFFFYPCAGTAKSEDENEILVLTRDDCLQLVVVSLRCERAKTFDFYRIPCNVEFVTRLQF